MNFTTHNNDVFNENGTSLVGQVDATYDELKELFGTPIIRMDGKTDAVWKIKFSDDTIATVYNWKNGKAYLGESGLDVSRISTWNVGGFSPQALMLVQLTLELMRDAKPKDKFEQAFSSAFDMMESIASTKGKEYARLVEVAMLVMKRRDMMTMLIDLAVAAADMPESVKDILMEADTAMSVKTISAACNASGITFGSQDSAAELMDWATRIINAEVSGVEEVIQGAKKK